MPINKELYRLFLSLVTVVLIIPSLALAGGYLVVTNAGVPIKWDNTSPVPFNPDGGGFGVFIANPDAVAYTQDALDDWAVIPTADLSFVNAGPLTAPGFDGDVNTIPEFFQFFNQPDGFSPVVFDEDGSLFDALFGPGTGVLGFALVEVIQLTAPFNITEAFQAYNGRFIDGDPTNGEFSLDVFSAVITHEFGHTLNLDHTQVNGHFFIGDTDDPGFVTYGTPPDGSAMMMFPFLFSQEELNALDPLSDDIAFISNLYPAPVDVVRISGRVFESDGSTQLQGANVIARNVDNPFFDAVSNVSGYLYNPFGVGPGPPPPGLEGRYDLVGLTPGASYTVEKVQVNPLFVGGSGVGPIDPPIFILIEEFYNGANEAGTNPPDDPLDFVLVSPNAEAIDIICNFSPLLRLGDDDFVNVSLPFDFPFCGTDYSSVFVGSNGFLTFRIGDTNPIESVPQLLSGPPRIAALWHDLNPSAGGSIEAEEVDGNFVITYEGVPEFPAVGSNDFAIILRPDGSFAFNYGPLSTTDALVGSSPGLGFATDPGEIDLTSLDQPIAGSPGDAVYELFDAGDNDLAGELLKWAPCPGFDIVITLADPGVCYASTGFAGGGVLITINPATGAGTLVNPTGLFAVPGLAINSKLEIFATDVNLAPGNLSSLYRIDAATGKSIVLFNTGLPFVDAIAFDENDVLYAMSSAPTALFTIDTETGTTTPVGAPGVEIRGMAFDPTDGTLFGSTGAGFDQIYIIDKTNGAATLIGSTGFGGSTPDIHFDDDGNLFGSKGGGGSINNLVAIDKTTGAGTVIGSIGFPAVAGMAFSRGAGSNLGKLAAESTTESLPTAFALDQNYPNPFNPETKINYQLPEESNVLIKIFNLKGQLVWTLLNEFKAPGYYTVVWDGRDASGLSIPSGTYFYQIKAEGFQQVRKMTLLK